LGDSPPARGGCGLGIRLPALPGVVLSADSRTLLSGGSIAPRFRPLAKTSLLDFGGQFRGLALVVSDRARFCLDRHRAGFLPAETAPPLLAGHRGAACLAGKTAVCGS